MAVQLRPGRHPAGVQPRPVRHPGAYQDLGFNVSHSKLLGLIQHSFTLNARTLTYLALGLAAYALIELVEGIGLWLGRRWGEYFAMVATRSYTTANVHP